MLLSNIHVVFKYETALVVVAFNQYITLDKTIFNENLPRNGEKPRHKAGRQTNATNNLNIFRLTDANAMYFTLFYPLVFVIALFLNPHISTVKAFL